MILGAVLLVLAFIIEIMLNEIDSDGSLFVGLAEASLFIAFFMPIVSFFNADAYVYQEKLFRKNPSTA